MSQHVFDRTVKIDGLSIFYREAGPKDAPTILLLHGLPSSSRMFEPLFARLCDRYHLVSPDYPGLRARLGADTFRFPSWTACAIHRRHRLRGSPHTAYRP
jgi:pimeloyl-ACP methyl ester carboxylesterase